ncbi:glycoside hydrolase family 130 protein [Flavitalea flava]
MGKYFSDRLENLNEQHAHLLQRRNEPLPESNGVYVRYRYPIVSAQHTPLFWRYDLDKERNPFLIERFGINAAFNAGAIKWKDKYLLIVRVEGTDRKSFFAICESPNGVDDFRFWDYPVQIPETDVPDTNIYDMRIVLHEDGWLYGLFCTERKDPAAKVGDETAAVAQCGIVRTRDLVEWERLPDLVTPSPQQRNVVLHPEWVNGQYAFYTRPQDSFIGAGSVGGIGFGLSPSIDPAVIEKEWIIDERIYHTVNELKNGLGPSPLKTGYGWLHLAHGVRNTAAGMRYVLYLFMTDLKDLTRVTHKPGGYFLAPEGEERIGDVSNVVFSNGWIADEDGSVYIYYASSDSRIHVAVSTIDRLLDYVLNNPADGLSSAQSLNTLVSIIRKNKNNETLAFN